MQERPPLRAHRDGLEISDQRCRCGRLGSRGRCRREGRAESSKGQQDRVIGECALAQSPSDPKHAQQLSDIARPRTVAQGIVRGRVDTHPLPYREVPHQNGDVFRALAEGRNEQEAIVRQAVKEIVTKAIACREGGKILVGSRNDRDIHRDRRASPHASEGLALDGTQHFCLMVAAHRADLVEEHGAAMGAFQHSRLVYRSGKRTTGRAEELALQMVLGNRRAIEYLGWARGSIRSETQSLGNELFADTTLTLDQERSEAATPDGEDLVPEVHDGRRDAEELGRDVMCPHPLPHRQRHRHARSFVADSAAVNGPVAFPITGWRGDHTCPRTLPSTRRAPQACQLRPAVQAESGMELQVVSAGSYPRIGDATGEQRLRYAYASFRSGELTVAALRQIEDEVAASILAEQVAAGLDLVTDGLVRWYDPISHMAQALMGIEPGPLRAYFETGSEYRQARVRGPLLRNRSLVADEYVFASAQSPRPVRAILTGPVTLACASVIETPAYPSLAILARSYAEILAAEVEALVEAGARHIQIDEPAVARQPDLVELAAEALRPIAAVKGGAELTLALFLGDPGHTLPTLAALPIDVLAIDILHSPRAVEVLLESPPPQRLALGVVDATNVTSDDVASRARTIEPLLAKLGTGPHYLTSTGGLEQLPRASAREKLTSLTRVRDALAGDEGAAA